MSKTQTLPNSFFDLFVHFDQQEVIRPHLLHVKLILLTSWVGVVVVHVLPLQNAIFISPYDGEDEVDNFFAVVIKLGHEVLVHDYAELLFALVGKIILGGLQKRTLGFVLPQVPVDGLNFFKACLVPFPKVSVPRGRPQRFYIFTFVEQVEKYPKLRGFRSNSWDGLARRTGVILDANLVVKAAIFVVPPVANVVPVPIVARRSNKVLIGFFFVAAKRVVRLRTTTL